MLHRGQADFKNTHHNIFEDISAIHIIYFCLYLFSAKFKLLDFLISSKKKKAIRFKEIFCGQLLQ